MNISEIYLGIKSTAPELRDRLFPGIEIELGKLWPEPRPFDLTKYVTGHAVRPLCPGFLIDVNAAMDLAGAVFGGDLYVETTYRRYQDGAQMWGAKIEAGEVRSHRALSNVGQAAAICLAIIDVLHRR